ncbi:placenta-specific gene 8 protein [Cynocephalus volans]|uniref:placenta-specific gene 8 protein n=1 Tax=Cynocephalus volans TaxID=110931 RepID=UPI002FC8FA35
MQAQAPVVVVTQPGYSSGPAPQNSNWQTGVCDCFSDCGVCLCGTFCFICLACQVAADMNECCLCGTSVAMRTLYRTRYGIPGSICDDYMTTLCCPYCSLCQIKRDINRRRAMRAF